jgi:hypothetical protein
MANALRRIYHVAELENLYLMSCGKEVLLTDVPYHRKHMPVAVYGKHTSISSIFFKTSFCFLASFIVVLSLASPMLTET